MGFNSANIKLIIILTLTFFDISKCSRFEPTIQLMILNGENVESLAHQVPYIAALGYFSEEEQNYDFKCGGSIISLSYVLTAAHCITDKLKFVRVNSPKIEVSLEELGENDLQVEETFVHPDYDVLEKVADIAVLKLQEHNKTLVPISLYYFNDTPAVLTIAGWGRLAADKDESTHLQIVEVPSVPFEKCRNLYSNEHNISSSHICAGTSFKAACLGDSGGPLHTSRFNQFFLVGVTSFGDACGGVRPGVFARVSSHLTWIKNVTSV